MAFSPQVEIMVYSIIIWITMVDYPSILHREKEKEREREREKEKIDEEI